MKESGRSTVPATPWGPSLEPFGCDVEVDPVCYPLEFARIIFRFRLGLFWKTGRPRQIKIRPNLFKWLKRFQGDILPTNSSHELREIRKQFKLSHDVLRHTFISKHIGAFKSFADAAIESGNSEKIIRDHYLNTSSLSDAKQFWRVEPK